jgi:hypothetical protein
LLPDPPRREQKALYSDCTTDARGVCILHGVAPGDYHAYTVPREAALDFPNPDSAKELEKQAKAVKVAEGDHQSLQLEATPSDR